MPRVSLQPCREPGARRFPVPLHGDRRHLQHLGHVLLAQAAEESQLDDPRRARVGRRPAPTSSVSRSSSCSLRRGRDPAIDVRTAGPAAARRRACRRPGRARGRSGCAASSGRRSAKKCARSWYDTGWSAEEAEVELVDDGVGLEGVVAALAAQEPGGQLRAAAGARRRRAGRAPARRPARQRLSQPVISACRRTRCHDDRRGMILTRRACPLYGVEPGRDDRAVHLQPTVSPDQFRRARAMFESALDWPPAERDAAAPGGRAAATARLRRLVAADAAGRRRRRIALLDGGPVQSPPIAGTPGDVFAGRLPHRRAARHRRNGRSLSSMG